MEIFIVYGIVCIPLIAIGYYSLYRTIKEERKEEMQSKAA